MRAPFCLRSSKRKYSRRWVTDRKHHVSKLQIKTAVPARSRNLAPSSQTSSVLSISGRRAEPGGVWGLPEFLCEHCWPLCLIRETLPRQRAGRVRKEKFLQGHRIQDHPTFCQEVHPDTDVWPVYPGGRAAAAWATARWGGGNNSHSELLFYLCPAPYFLDFKTEKYPLQTRFSYFLPNQLSNLDDYTSHTWETSCGIGNIWLSWL